MKSLFEQMGGTYRQEGDYLIPNLALPDIGDNQIGKYGRMRRRYLKEHRRILYTDLLTSGNLRRHLTEIDQACNERMESIVSAMAKQEGVAEALKAADQMEWVRRMNSIRNRAEEIVLKPTDGFNQIRFFQLCDKITGGSNGIACNSGYVGTSKDAINAHACEYCFGFFNRSLACVQSVNRNLNRKIIRSNRNIFIFNHNFSCVNCSPIIQVIQRNLK